MVEPDTVWRQLTVLRFGFSQVNRAEIKQLPKILEPGEKILECVNGWYHAGIALLVATNRRVVLVDHKPFGPLHVQSWYLPELANIQHTHHIAGSRLQLHHSSGKFDFNSINRLRLRRFVDRLLGRLFEVQQWQRRQAEQAGQHLSDMNQQLQEYALAQHEQLQKALSGAPPAAVAPPKIDSHLADYLFAQQLLKQYGPPASERAPALAAAAIAAAVQAEAKIVHNVVRPAYSRTNNFDLLGDAKAEVLRRATVTPVGF